MDESPETRLSLLRRVRDASDNVAWEKFVKTYGPLVYRVAHRRGLQDAASVTAAAIWWAISCCPVHCPVSARMASAIESLRQPLSDCPDCGLSPVCNTDLPQNVLDVLLDGLIANA